MHTAARVRWLAAVVALLPLQAQGLAAVGGYSWSSAGSMATPRQDAAAVLLANGEALVVGGRTTDALALSGAEIFNPDTSSWRSAPSMNLAHASLLGVLLQSGKVLVIATDSTTDVELFDPSSSGGWTDGGALPESLKLATANVLADGRVLVSGVSLGNPVALLYAPASGTWSPLAAGGSSWSSTSSLLADGTILATRADGATSIFDPGSGSWRSAGLLNLSREGATATVMPDGEVLVVGGTAPDGGASQPTPERYDPAAGTWSLLGADMPVPLAAHTANLMPYGQLVVAGGRTATSSVQTFGPVSTGTNGLAAATWSLAPNMNTARADSASVLLGDGRLLVVGGALPDGGPTATAELLRFDAIQNQGAPVSFGEPFASATGSNASPVLTGLVDGSVLAVGGGSQGQDAFLISGGSLASTGALNQPGFSGTATLLRNGEVLALTSSSSVAELYDPTTHAWVNTGSLATGPRVGPSAALLPDGTVLIAGGLIAGGAGPTTSAELFDLTSGSFSATGSMGKARVGAPAVLLPNGKVLVGSSTAALGWRGANELYDPASRTWAFGASNLDPRSGDSLTLLPNGKLLAAGGTSTVSGAVLASAELYDPAANSWSATGSMLTARKDHAAVLLRDGRVLVTGGSAAAGTSLGSAEVYDPTTGAWSVEPSLQSARALHSGLAMDDGSVVFAGGLGPTALATFEVFSAPFQPYRTLEPFYGARIAPGQSFYQGTNMVAASWGEAACGTGACAAANFPLLTFERVDNHARFHGAAQIDDGNLPRLSYLFYAPLTSGIYRTWVSMDGISSPATTLVVTPHPTHAAFTNPPRSLVAGGCAGPLILQSRGSAGEAEPTFYVNIPVTSSYATGTFWSDASCSVALPSATAVITGADYTTSGFYYSDTRAGSATLSGGNFDLSPASQPVTISPGPASQLVLNPPVAWPDACGSVQVSLQAKDAYGNDAPGAVGVALALPADGGAYFTATSLAGAGGIGTSQLSGSTDASGSASATVFAAGPGSFTLAASSSFSVPANLDITFLDSPADPSATTLAFDAPGPAFLDPDSGPVMVRVTPANGCGGRASPVTGVGLTATGPLSASTPTLDGTRNDGSFLASVALSGCPDGGAGTFGVTGSIDGQPILDDGGQPVVLPISVTCPQLDAGAPDAGTPDAGVPDAGTFDAGALAFDANLAADATEARQGSSVTFTATFAPRSVSSVAQASISIVVDGFSLTGVSRRGTPLSGNGSYALGSLDGAAPVVATFTATAARRAASDPPYLATVQLFDGQGAPLSPPASASLVADPAFAPSVGCGCSGASPLSNLLALFGVLVLAARRRLRIG